MSKQEEQSLRTELSELGEFGLIERLTNSLSLKRESSVFGVGDDCAVIHSGNRETLVTTDLLVEGVHFDMTYMPLKHLGYKAAVVNISDIVAMNGEPTQLIVGLAISNRFSVEAIEELFSGIRLACEIYNVDLVGGDTVSSVTGLMISITALGTVEKSDIIYRHTAKKGDLLCVSGNLGAAYAGLLILEREKQAYKGDPNVQPDLDGYDYTLERQLKPEVRTDIQQVLRENEIKPTAMIDVSDGLASEILHICTRSKLGCSLYEDKIPIDVTVVNTAKEFEIDPTTFALNGGEDYELLFTVQQNDYDKIKDIQDVSIIGHMTDAAEGVNLISRSGTQVKITAQGWDAFLKKQSEGDDRPK
jgi:thiamine-monophosphate kinase